MKTATTTRKATTKKVVISHYEALANLPGGVKVGDMFTVEDGVTKNHKQEVIGYNPAQEPTFFRFVIPILSKFKVGQEFILRTIENLSVVKYSYGHMSKHTRMQIFTPYTITQVKEEVVNRKKTIMYYFEHGGTTYRVEEAKAHEFIPYYFLSSTGKVQRAIVGQDEHADKFRRQSNIFYEDKEAATQALALIMNS